MRLLLPKSCLVKLLSDSGQPIALFDSAVISRLGVRLLDFCHLA